MKYMSLPILLVVCLEIFSSCTTLKRYSSVRPKGTDNNLAGVDLFGFRLSEARPVNENKTLWDLSADAQSQFIKILNTRYPENEQFLKAMSYEYLNYEVPSVPDNYVKKDLRMIFSVTRQRDYGNKDYPSGPKLSPADRIEYLKITLRIPEDSGIRFTGWNMFTTEYGSVDIADVSFSRSLEIDASGLLLTDKATKSTEISAGGRSSTNRKEDQEIKYRYLKLNGRISNHEIEMEEEGTREIDLTGNILADLSLEFDKFPEILTDISGIKDSTGRYNEPDKLTIKFSETTVPAMETVKDTVFADLTMDYVFRNVINGERTFAEWDDHVRYYNGSVSKRVPLFTSGDFIPDFYCIGNPRNNTDRSIVKIVTPAKKEYSVIFRSYKEAQAFYEWLAGFFNTSGNLNKSVTIGGYRLKFKDDDLTGNKFEELYILPFYR
ncbi:MAG: hypothetical protein IPN67_16395 [Bacteroidales bacterium]|nr:hypothetical protein [Bacteroidales bacterium]